MENNVKNKSKGLQTYCYESFSIQGTCTHFVDLLIAFGGFGILIDIPCEFKRLCLTNLTHPNCFSKSSSFSIHEKTLHGIDPTPHIGMPMTCNNLLNLLEALHFNLKSISLTFSFIFRLINCLIFIANLLCLWVVQNASIHGLVVLSP